MSFQSRVSGFESSGNRKLTNRTDRRSVVHGTKFHRRTGNATHAQSSVEFLVMLSVALLALLIFISMSQSEGVGIGTTKIKSEARNAVKEISSAAEDVYAQGTGAKKKIKVMIPAGYEPSLSSIGNHSIRIRAGDDDYVRTVDFELTGNLPAYSGFHEIWITSEGSQVRVGNAMIFLGRQTINTVMGRNGSRPESFSVKNIWDSQITVNISNGWNHSDVGLSLSQDSFVLAKGATETVTATFTSGSDALGFYTGSLDMTGNDGAGNNESVTLPLTVEVSVGGDSGDGPPLTVVPSIWQESIARNSSATSTFQVCTNARTSLASVNFTPSVGEPGEWVGMSEPLLNLDPGTCQMKTLNVSVPGNATIEEHSGYVYLSGNPNGNDVISLSVRVGGDVNDLESPSITEISIFPSGRAVFVQDPVAVRAIVDDRSTGNNPIDGCRVKIDSGSWYQMISSDGNFDEPVETAGYSFYTGFSLGSHIATVNCTDAKNNSAIANTSFKVMKEFLFITENSTPDTDEQDWMDWIGLGLSDEGYAWNYDSTDSSSFISGSPNLSFYSVVVAERWVNQTQTRLNSHVNSGGSIVMLGNAVIDAPLALALSALSGTNDSDTNINSLNDSHYITSGYNGITQVTNSSTNFGTFWKDLSSGTLLAKSMINTPPHWHVLGISGTRYFWGPTTPDYMNPVGINITKRTLDHAINASSVGVG